MNYKLNIQPINGLQTNIFNAAINAFRCGNFINYSHHFENELPVFFQGIEIEIQENSKSKSYKLEIYFKNILIKDLISIFEDVLKARKEELSFLLKEKEQTFEELDSFSKIRYLLLFKYGEKIGGFNSLITMSVAEVINLFNYFEELDSKSRVVKKDKK